MLSDSVNAKHKVKLFDFIRYLGLHLMFLSHRRAGLA